MKASFFRTGIAVLAVFGLTNSALAALDFPFSIGLGLDVIGSGAYGAATTKEEYAELLSDWSWSENFSATGAYIFFDARYVELDIGVNVFETSSSRYGYEVYSTEPTEYIDEKIRNVSGTLLDFSLVGKYPFDIGRKKMFSIAPAIGLSYRMFVDKRGYYDGDASDFNSFVINTGVIGNFNFSIPIYLRFGLMIGYRFPSERERNIGDKYTKYTIEKNKIVTPWDEPLFGAVDAKVTFAVGFRLNKSGNNTVSENKPSVVESTTEE